MRVLRSLGFNYVSVIIKSDTLLPWTLSRKVDNVLWMKTEFG